VRRQKLRRGEILIKAAVLVGMAAVIRLAISMDDTLCAQTASPLHRRTPPPLPRRQRKQSACMFTPLRNKTNPSRQRARASAIPLLNSKRAGTSCARATGSRRGRSQRGAVKGAAGGAVGGAAFGAIAGDAGEGAAIGATVGAVKGRRQQKKAQEQGEQQAKQTARTQQSQQLDGFRRSMDACLEARGYTAK